MKYARSTMSTTIQKYFIKVGYRRWGDCFVDVIRENGELLPLWKKAKDIEDFFARAERAGLKFHKDMLSLRRGDYRFFKEFIEEYAEEVIDTISDDHSLRIGTAESSVQFYNREGHGNNHVAVFNGKNFEEMVTMFDDNYLGTVRGDDIGIFGWDTDERPSRILGTGRFAIYKKYSTFAICDRRGLF